MAEESNDQIIKRIKDTLSETPAKVDKGIQGFLSWINLVISIALFGGWIVLMEWGWKRLFPTMPCPYWLQFVLCIVGLAVLYASYYFVFGWAIKVHQRRVKAQLAADLATLKSRIPK